VLKLISRLPPPAENWLKTNMPRMMSITSNQGLNVRLNGTSRGRAGQRLRRLGAVLMMKGHSSTGLHEQPVSCRTMPAGSPAAPADGPGFAMLLPSDHSDGQTDDARPGPR